MVALLMFMGFVWFLWIFTKWATNKVYDRRFPPYIPTYNRPFTKPEDDSPSFNPSQDGDFYDRWIAVWWRGV